MIRGSKQVIERYNATNLWLATAAKEVVDRSWASDRPKVIVSLILHQTIPKFLQLGPARWLIVLGLETRPWTSKIWIKRAFIEVTFMHKRALKLDLVKSGLGSGITSHFKRIFTILTRMSHTSLVYMCQYATTKRCSRKEESTSCRDVSKYATLKECTR